MLNRMLHITYHAAHRQLNQSWRDANTLGLETDKLICQMICDGAHGINITKHYASYPKCQQQKTGAPMAVLKCIAGFDSYWVLDLGRVISYN